VGDIVRAADQGSPWSRVVRIEDVGPVVGFSEPERQAADAAARAAGAVAAEQAAADRTFLARVAGFAGQSSRLVTVVAIAAAVVALAYIVSNARGAAAALSGK
jgi:hypothetical protein